LSALVLLGACLSARGAEAKSYKGAEVFTKATYQYGRIEVRIRSAKGGGILSTFFTYKPGSEGAGVSWEEIDVEIFGKSNANAFQSNILVGNPRMGSEQVHEAATSLGEQYHTYTVEWTPTYVAWLVDGVESRRTTGGQATQLISKHNFRFNLWASDVSSWAGAFESASLPQYQFVNWIRYYRYEGGAFVLDWTDDFNTFDTARWPKAAWTFAGILVDFDPNNAVVRDGTLVLCLTAQGQACTGAVPVDPSGNAGSGAGGTGNGGAAGAAGAAGASSLGGAGGSGGASSAGASGNGGAAGGSAGSNAAGTAAGGVAPTAGSGSAAGGVGGMASAGSPASAGTAAGTPSPAGGPSVGGAPVSAGAGTAGTPVNNGATPPVADAGGCGVVVAPRVNRGWLALALGLGLAAVLRRKRAR